MARATSQLRLLGLEARGRGVLGAEARDAHAGEVAAVELGLGREAAAERGPERHERPAERLVRLL